MEASKSDPIPSNQPIIPGSLTPFNNTMQQFTFNSNTNTQPRSNSLPSSYPSHSCHSSRLTRSSSPIHQKRKQIKNKKRPRPKGIPKYKENPKKPSIEATVNGISTIFQHTPSDQHHPLSIPSSISNLHEIKTITNGKQQIPDGFCPPLPFLPSLPSLNNFTMPSHLKIPSFDDLQIDIQSTKIDDTMCDMSDIPSLPSIPSIASMTTSFSIANISNISPINKMQINLPNISSPPSRIELPKLSISVLTTDDIDNIDNIDNDKNNKKEQELPQKTKGSIMAALNPANIFGDGVIKKLKKYNKNTSNKEIIIISQERNKKKKGSILAALNPSNICIDGICKLNVNNISINTVSKPKPKIKQKPKIKAPPKPKAPSKTPSISDIKQSPPPLQSTATTTSIPINLALPLPKVQYLTRSKCKELREKQKKGELTEDEKKLNNEYNDIKTSLPSSLSPSIPIPISIKKPVFEFDV